MKKIMVCAAIVLSGFAVAGSYHMDIQVAPTKPGGKSWDIAGGAPDIRFAIDGKTVHLEQKCIDTYRCTRTVSLLLDKEKFYIEVYDRDLKADDLIGKGECRVGEVCKVGRAGVTLKPVTRMTLADASVTLQGKLEAKLDEMLAKDEIETQDVQEVTQMLRQLQSWHRPLNESVRQKLRKLQKKLPDLNDVIEQVDTMPMVG